MNARLRHVLRERGVAMVTVLLIGAALTALTSTAAFVTIEEFGATQADRNAAQALSYAEAGIDRMLLKIRNSDEYTWNDLSTAGCDADHPTLVVGGSIGNGTYETTLEVYDPEGTAAARFVPTACDADTVSSDPRVNSAGEPHHFVLTSTGVQPEARRVVRQIIQIEPLGLPIGIYAYDTITANGAVTMENISMITEGVVRNRDNLHLSGTDPYYTMDDYYDDGNDDVQMPAAVHAQGTIYYGPNNKDIEHRTGFEPNCVANGSQGTSGQSLWDGSGTAIITTGLTTGCASWPGSTYVGENPPLACCVTSNINRPPTSKFDEEARRNVAPSPTLTEQDYLTLRSAARQSGLYCSGATAGTLTCTESGRTESGNPYAFSGSGKLDADDIDDVSGRAFVVYFEFTNNGADPFSGDRTVEWTGGADIGPCTLDPFSNKSAVVVVRRGTLFFSGGSEINGALLVPEGAVITRGGFAMTGTVIARRIESTGNSGLRLSPCWLNNLPGPFLDITASTWTEVDR